MQPPQSITIKSDGNILTFVEITKLKTYKYQYTKSITKLGLFIEFSESELVKICK
jgi:hypothetical protein